MNEAEPIGKSLSSMDTSMRNAVIRNYKHVCNEAENDNSLFSLKIWIEKCHPGIETAMEVDEADFYKS